MNLIKILEEAIKNNKVEISEAQDRVDRMYSEQICDVDCCQVESSLAYFEGYENGLMKAIKLIMEDQEIDSILTNTAD